MSQEDEQIVKGCIKLGPEHPAFTDATVHVYLEDVSRADADANEIAHYTSAGISHGPGESSDVRFEIRGKSIDALKHYAVRAHIAPSGGTSLHTGSLITVQSYPVLTFGNPNQVTIEVKEIR